MDDWIVRLQQACPDLTLRSEGKGDDDFLVALYAETRQAELARVQWSPRQKAEFCRLQFEAQRRQYRQHYPTAAFLVMEISGERIGRLYLDRKRADLRLMEITLLPAWRNRGVGTALTLALIAEGEAARLPVSLHVEQFNPAYDLYTRLGFERRETRGIYEFMERCPAEAAA